MRHPKEIVINLKTKAVLNTTNKIFGLNPKVEYAELVKQGAIIIDMSNKGEYTDGHIKDSIKIPVAQFGQNI